MNFGGLKTLCSSWLDDLQFGYFTQPQVEVWLNNAQKEVQKRLIMCGQNYYLRCVQTTLVQNQKDYVLPLDFKKEHRLEIVISGTGVNESVTQVYPATLNQTKNFIGSGVGTPEAYFIKRNRLVLAPAPDLNLILRLFYSYQLTDMVLDTDVPDVPYAYQEMIAVIATKDGFLKDGRVPDMITAKMNEYDEMMKKDANERQQDLPRSIVETGFSYDGGFFW